MTPPYTARTDPPRTDPFRRAEVLYVVLRTAVCHIYLAPVDEPDFFGAPVVHFLEIIPGPKKPKDLLSFLYPVVDEFKRLAIVADAIDAVLPHPSSD